MVTVAKIVVILAFIVGGLWVMTGRPAPLAGFTPFLERGWSGVFAAMGLTFIAPVGVQPAGFSYPESVLRRRQ